MPKYKVTLTMKETYDLYVEAENEDEALDIARDTDVYEYEQVGVQTVDEDIVEVKAVTDEDNING
jgi:hypothetical protein